MKRSFANKISLFFTRLIEGCLTEAIKTQINHDLYRKIVIGHSVIVIGAITLFFFGMIAFFQENLQLGLLDLTISFFLIFNLLIFRRTGNYFLTCYLGIPVVAIFYFYLFVTGGVNNTAFVWLYTFPMFAFFLLGSRKGSMATLFLFVPVLIFLFFDYKTPFLTTYPFDLKIRFISSFLVVTTYAYIYERLREKTQGDLENNNAKLEKKVLERTADLQTAYEFSATEVDMRKRIEKRLARSNTSMLTILNSLDAIVYAADINTHDVLFMNKNAQKIFGDGVGKKCWQVFQKDQNGPCPFCSNKELTDMNGNQKCFFWEMKNTINGRWYEMRDCAASWVDDRVVRIQIATDITPRKIAEEKLMQSKKEWEATFDAIGEPVFILDKDFNIMQANKAFVKSIGLPRDSIVGQKCYELMHGSSMPLEDCLYKKLLQEGSYQSTELYEEKLGKDFFVSVSPIFDDLGNLQGGVHVALDISERKKAETEKNRLITELQQAMSQIKKLEGIIPICSYCKKIRDSDGYWNQLEKYISDHSEALFSHGVCKECAIKHFPEFYQDKQEQD